MLNRIREVIRRRKGLRGEQRAWIARGYASPSLSHIKRTVLLRNANSEGIWVETGTFQGETTELLANHGHFVHSIEPEPKLFSSAKERFLDWENVELHHGLSEKVFPELLPELLGYINFWLDGHYSGGITHQGPTDCPVEEELSQISKFLKRYEGVTVMIDDVRCFDPTIPLYADYPSLDYLVDWARANDLKWHIEHDIFIAKTRDA